MKLENRCALLFLLWSIPITIALGGCGGVSPHNNTPTQGSGNTGPDMPSEALYLSSRGGVTGFAINPADGSLSPLSGSPFASPLIGTVLTPSPSGRVMLAEGHMSNDLNSPIGIWVFRVNVQGGLQADPAPAVPSIGASGAFVRSVVFHPSGNLVYLSNFVGLLVISAHRFDESAGAIDSVPTSQVPISCNFPFFCSDSLMGMVGFSGGGSGDHLWAGGPSSSVVSGVIMNAMPVSNAGAAIGQPSELAIGGYTDEIPPTVSIVDDGLVTVEIRPCCGRVFDLHSYVFLNGQLVEMKGCLATNAACADADSILMHPNQKLAIVGDFDGRLFTATRDTAGNLSDPVPTGISAGIPPDELVLDPAGKFLYVMSAQSNLIFGFSLDANAGVLQAIPGSPWTVPGTNAGDGVLAPIAIRLPRAVRLPALD